jgi:hypothetical protein
MKDWGADEELKLQQFIIFLCHSVIHILKRLAVNYGPSLSYKMVVQNEEQAVIFIITVILV